MVVDDEPGLRRTLSLILEGEGHSVAVAEHGAAALDALRADDADLVLCDLRMPVMDGSEFLDRYRAGGGRALVVMMSAYGDDEQAIAAMQRGAYDYVPKPFRADQVLLVVRKAIARERLQREVAQLRDGARFAPEAPDRLTTLVHQRQEGGGRAQRAGGQPDEPVERLLGGRASSALAPRSVEGCGERGCGQDTSRECLGTTTRTGARTPPARVSALRGVD